MCYTNQAKPSLPTCDITFTGPQASGFLLTLSSWMVLEKAGQGEECSNLDVLENNSCPHSEHTYIPTRKKVKPTTSDTCHSKPWRFVFFATTHPLQSDFYILLHQRKSNMTFRPLEMYFYKLQLNDFRVQTLSSQIHPARAGKILLRQIKYPVCSLLYKMFPFLPLDGGKWQTTTMQTVHFSQNAFNIR